MSAVDGVPSEMLQTEAFVCNDPQAQRIAELERTCDLRGGANWVLSEENDRLAARVADLEAENKRLRELVPEFFKLGYQSCCKKSFGESSDRIDALKASGLGEG